MAMLGGHDTMMHSFDQGLFGNGKAAHEVTQ